MARPQGLPKVVGTGDAELRETTVKSHTGMQWKPFPPGSVAAYKVQRASPLITVVVASNLHWLASATGPASAGRSLPARILLGGRPTSS